MKRTNSLNTLLFALSFFASTTALAMTCPNMPPEDDWDGDGIKNGVDLCCFVTSEANDKSNGVCATPDSRDLNGNGISFAEEGNCCVNPTGSNASATGQPGRSHCFAIETPDDDTAGSNTCDTQASMEVPCDYLLVYDNMPVANAGDDAMAGCGSGTCICYTIGDYDGDNSLTTGGPAPFDNCPLQYESVTNWEANNSDGDFFGDKCDFCQNVVETPESISPNEAGSAEMFADILESMSCQIGADADCPGGKCVPRAILNPYYTWNAPENEDNYPAKTRIIVENICSSSADADADKYGDICDNCVDIKNPRQEDIDSDGVGNYCDACPTNADIVNNDAGLADGDSDKIIDECDNCISRANKDQWDFDSDMFGDVCDICPNDDSIIEGDLGDADKDGVADICDPCPLDAGIAAYALYESLDFTDIDGDGHADFCDNCPNDENPDQKNADSDSYGDICDDVFDSDTNSDTTLDTDTDKCTDSCVGDTDSTNMPHPKGDSDTGVVAFSGGGLISCTASGSGAAPHLSIFALLLALF